ncbi:hypothetical protein N7448_005398 [Penicillium atrosanguineum]|uniref:Tubby C-terminal-like domain-containing protein n=1 Tax=Penicillium atrosanguineum TaxID=1132637 RepID=A0A9W9U0H3_9EURO|nr:uncharacterized protein N7443_009128 [Penicillium atrosanguineum]KAJ5136844.1 hypothetical protein N7448_005398 [Penicillium atrosanguineum]KAJ5293175.1 hypothetical protein N7443_009128 [Penicillium atrosanguineum]KAJ5302788.1 hypothetical protein N7476_009587 [Penicillium atrosanguineum]
MSYTSYSDARMSHNFRPTPRKSLRSPEREIAFRKEQIATTKRSLILKPQGDAQSAISYKITDEHGVTEFTVTGRKYGDRSCRELRDSSGLPYFELHTSGLASLSSRWYITLPGGGDQKVAKAGPQFSWNGSVMKFTFQNMAASDTKRAEDKELTLNVTKHGAVLNFFDIVDVDRRIAEVRESVQHNEKLNLRKSSRGGGHRPTLDLTVMPGVDVSLVAAIAVILSDWYFGSN